MIGLGTVKRRLNAVASCCRLFLLRLQPARQGMINELAETAAAGIEPFDLLDRQVRVDGVLASEPSLAVGTIRHEWLHAVME